MTTINKIFEILSYSAIRGFSPIPTCKNFKKTLTQYNVPPRSMTKEEEAYYSKHKHLNGMSK